MKGELRAAFTKAVRWQAEAVCMTPLRTGGPENDPETVLFSHTGRALLQGSSIAGCLREWMMRSGYSEALVERLFGSRERSGSLRVSDGVFAPGSEMAVRPRLKLDGAAGSAEDGKKFDMAHMAAGSRLGFSLTWLGDEPGEEASAAEAVLAALNAGEITLGAQHTNGFGRVTLTVMKRCFDLLDAEDRNAWLEDEEGGQVCRLPESVRSRSVRFTAVGTADSLLVKSSRTVELSGTDKGSYTENLREAGRPVLPGSSVKGALRARAETIAKYMGLPEELTEDVFGFSPAAAGDQGRPGRVRFEDVTLAEPVRRITRIRINKLTGGVMRGGLFKEEPVCGEVSLRVSVEEDCAEGCGLVLYALRDLGLGLWGLGSGSAIGRGYLRLRELRAETPEGECLQIRFSEDGSCSAEDPAGLAERWGRALKEARA